jgi:hypothetical protein
LVDSSFKLLDPAAHSFDALLETYDEDSPDYELLDASQRLQFAKDLENEDKLSLFLEMLARRCPAPLYGELRYLAYQAWEHFLAVRGEDIGRSELLGRA